MAQTPRNSSVKVWKAAEDGWMDGFLLYFQLKIGFFCFFFAEHCSFLGGKKMFFTFILLFKILLFRVAGGIMAVILAVTADLGAGFARVKRS